MWSRGRVEGMALMQWWKEVALDVGRMSALPLTQDVPQSAPVHLKLPIPGSRSATKWKHAQKVCTCICIPLYIVYMHVALCSSLNSLNVTE